MKVLIQNGTIVTMNATRDIFAGDILVEGNLIRAIGKNLKIPSGAVEVYDASGQLVIPGLIQAHTHLVQTLFRGEADDLALLDWLKKRIWPLEAAHNAASIRASAQLGILEMQKSGTTSILDMGTVNHTNELLQSVQGTGLRYWGGKCLMDSKPRSGPLWESTNAAISESEALISTWSGKDELIQYALCPRFAVSCTKALFEAIRDLQKSKNLLVHTHASESVPEIKLVKKITGKGNIAWFDHLKLLGPKTVIVHAVHVSASELSRLKKTKTPVVHCPSSNLKLGSGIAPMEKYRKLGLKIGLGSDGAPCNNTMDAFKEIHLAALLQKPLFGPRAMAAKAAFELATLGGARVLGQEKVLGSLEAGKIADIVTVDLSHPSVATVEDPYSALVYSCNGRDVRNVMINGNWIVRERRHKILDEEAVVASAKNEKRRLFSRAF